MAKYDPFHFATGYLKENETATAIFNIITAGLILLLALPIFIIVPIIIKLIDKGPVYYSGVRLGKDKSLFTMYKFRTLRVDAERILGANLVVAKPVKTTTQPSDDTPVHLETNIGRFLRDTRIDELPQLFNVLKGEMDIIGPRPERPLIYDEFCCQIPWYDKRFKVKPGLIGYSQLFTPHSASRRTRSLIDNLYIKRKRSLVADFIFLFYALTILLFKLIRKVIKSVFKIAKNLYQKHRFYIEEHRNYYRIEHANSRIKIWYKQTHPELNCVIPPADLQGEVLNINDQDICARFESPLTDEIDRIQLVTQYKPFLFTRARHKSAQCKSTLKMEKTGDNLKGTHSYYILSMLDISPLNQLKLDKYFLNKSIS